MSTFDPLCALHPFLDPQRGGPHSVPGRAEPFPNHGVAVAAMTYVKPQNNAAVAACGYGGCGMIEEDGRAGFGSGDAVHDGRRASDRTERGTLSDHARNRIGGHLRAMYDAVVQQPVPDRFLELIERLGQDADEPKRSN